MEAAARSSSSQVPPRAKRPRRRSTTTAAAQIDVLEAAAARSSSPQVRRRAKRQTTSTAAAQIDVLPAVGIEAQVPPRAKRPRTTAAAQIDAPPAAAGSASRRAKSKRRRRRTAQIGIPSRRAKTVRQQHLVGGPVSSNPPHSNWVCWGGRRPRSTSPQCLEDASNNHRGGEKRTGTWRDWSGLGDGPAGLIADRVLAYDVADYVRFRAVCRPWRQCSTDPRSHGRRFHPWRWTMLGEKHAALGGETTRCSFLNTSTAECVQVHIPELRHHHLLALTPEGLLVLLLHDRKHIRLLNPLTRHLIQLPPLATLLPPRDHRRLLEETTQYLNIYVTAWGSGFAHDNSTFVLCFNDLSIIGMAKPGDDRWRSLHFSGNTLRSTPVMIAGRFYCIEGYAVKMLKIAPHMKPCLSVAAQIKGMYVTPMADTMHLANNGGELMLMHRHCGPLTVGKQWWVYDMYRVDLDTETLVPVKSLGGAGRALFMGCRCSLSVSLEAFPSGSISADTMYLGFDFSERSQLRVGAYHLADGSVEVPCSLVQPHTLAGCLSLANTILST